jgi:hypothetical protein
MFWFIRVVGGALVKAFAKSIGLLLGCYAVSFSLDWFFAHIFFSDPHSAFYLLTFIVALCSAFILILAFIGALCTDKKLWTAFRECEE